MYRKGLTRIPEYPNQWSLLRFKHYSGKIEVVTAVDFQRLNNQKVGNSKT
jgi:hypothetical protein